MRHCLIYVLVASCQKRELPLSVYYYNVQAYPPVGTSHCNLLHYICGSHRQKTNIKECFKFNIPNFVHRSINGLTICTPNFRAQYSSSHELRVIEVAEYFGPNVRFLPVTATYVYVQNNHETLSYLCTCGLSSQKRVAIICGSLS